jgi:hypothetical protein
VLHLQGAALLGVHPGDLRKPEGALQRHRALRAPAQHQGVPRLAALSGQRAQGGLQPQHLFELSGQLSQLVDELAPGLGRQFSPAPERQTDHEQRHQLRREGLGRRNAHLPAGPEIDERVGLAGQGALRVVDER